MENIIQNKKPRFFKLLKSAWINFSSKISDLLIPIFLPLVVVSIVLPLSLLLTRLFISNTPGNFSLTILAAILLIILLATFAAYLLSQIAILDILLKNKGEKSSFKQSYKKALSVFWSYLLIIFLIGIISLGAGILLVVPGAFFSIVFSLAPILLITDGEKGFFALLKSKFYINGSFKWVLINVIFISIFYAIINKILIIIFGNGESVAFMVIKSVISGLLTTYIMAFSVEMYKALKNYLGEEKLASIKLNRDDIKMPLIIADIGLVLLVIIFVISYILN